MRKKSISELLVVSGGDRKAKSERIEDEILSELEKGNYHTLVLFFMNASHFVLGCDFLGCIYCRLRRFVKTFSGRKRYHVLGAIDYVTNCILTVTNDTYFSEEN